MRPASQSLQRFVAAAAALFFFALALLVGYETYRNVLFLQKRMATEWLRHQDEITALQSRFQAQLRAARAEALRQRDALNHEYETRVQKLQDDADAAVRGLEGKLEADYAATQREQEAALQKQREAGQEQVDTQRAALQQTLKPREDELQQDQETHRKTVEQEVALQGRLRTAENRRARYEVETLDPRRTELGDLEAKANQEGWTRDATGRLRPQGTADWWEELKTLPSRLRSWWLELDEKLERAYRLTAEAETAQAAVNEQVARTRERLVALAQEVQTWAGRVNEKRTLLATERARLEGELSRLQRQVDDELRTWKLAAEADLLRRLQGMRDATAARKGTLREQAQAQVTRLREAERRQLREAEAWEQEQMDCLRADKDQALARLQSFYETQFKPWQKNETLRRLVGLLHVTTGLYAAILGIRCLARWLQLNDWCTEPHLVRPE